MANRGVLPLLLLLACLALVVVSYEIGDNGIRYEIEDAHVIGGSKRVSEEYRDYVTLLGDNETESIVIVSVNIPSDGTYMMRILWKLSMTTTKGYLSMYINGIPQSEAPLVAASEDWDLWYGAPQFRRGLNTIMLKTMLNINDIVRLDYIDIFGAIPFSARGATLPYVEMEAEDASYNGQKIGPSRDLYQLPTEASGRVAVQLNKGQSVEFTLKEAANALTVRFSIPDTSDGSGQTAPLDVFVDNAKAFTLTLSSIYSWAYGYYPFTKRPSDGLPHHFYDEVRGMFGKTVQAGSKVRLVAVSSITYTIDLADFYNVPAPYAMPSGYISVTDNGADPSGNKDSTAAINNTINTATAQGKGVWIPQGTFLVNSRFVLNKVTVRGAGPWYTTVKATVNHGVGFFGGWAPSGSTNVQLYDFAISGDTNVRDDDAPDSGAGGALSNTLIQNLWIEHTKCGMWMDGPFDGFHVTGTIIRNTYADGINFHTGVTNSVVEQSMLRNLGDDGLAVWSEKVTDSKIVFKFNTIQVPILANGIALYGGQDNSATDNYVADTICDGGGLQIGNRYQAIEVAGTTTFARTTLVRCGAPSRFSPYQECGSIWIFQEQGVFGGTTTFSDIDTIDSSFAAITFWDGNYNNNVVLSNINVKGGPYVMEVNSASGTVPCDHIVATNVTGSVHSCAGLYFVDKGGNSGWDMNHDHQKC